MSNPRIQPLRPAIIAIDGPAASGKSTVGHQLAQQLGFLFFDSGIMYRVVTWAALANGLALNDEQAVTALSERLRIDILPSDGMTDGRQNTVLADGVDVTWQIRSPQVDRNVSQISAYPGVRQALSDQQRRIAHHYGDGQAEKPGIVMVGRDIGTVVVPEAPLKLYLLASAAERARRRYVELQGRGQAATFEQILADIERRDKIDSQRAVAPMRPAADAVMIDTTHLTQDDVLARMLLAVEQIGIRN